MTNSSNTFRRTGALCGKWRQAALASVAVLALSTSALAEAKPGDLPLSEEYLGTPPDLPITLSGSYLSGRIAGFNNDFGAAAAFFQEALNADNTNDGLLERTFRLKLANGEMIEATHYAQVLEDRDKGNFLSTLVLGSDAILKGDYQQGATIFGEPVSGPLAQLSTGIAHAWALYGAGQLDGAFEQIDRLSGPEWFIAFKEYHMGMIAFAAGQKERALDHIENAFQADSGAIRIVNAYARTLAANGDKDKALDVLDEYNALMNGHPLLLDTRDIVAGNAPIPPMIVDPAVGIAEILFGIGSAIGRDGGEELSMSYLRLALQLDPKAEFAAVALGGIYERLSKPAQAIAVLEMVPTDSVLKRNAEIQVGLNYNALEQLDQARDHLSALIEDDPKDVEAILTLGNILRSHEKFEEAEAIYTKAIDSLDEITSENWLAFYFRGICRERLKKWDAAEVDLRKALELNPDQPLVLNYLGYSLVDQGLKLDEALGMIEKAVELRPNDGYIVDSLGWVYYRLGRHEEAVKELERAVELRPADPVINDHLGDAYWKVGRRLEARFQWNHARDLEPTAEELPKILDKIANGMSEETGKDAAKAEGGETDG